MRVLRCIFRFLGISAIILYFLASISRADDVTVNFPSTMTVNGEVQVQGLGMEGNPIYDTSDVDGMVSTSLSGGTSTVIGDNSSPENFANTYISGYKKVTIWSGNSSALGLPGLINASTPVTYDLIISFPQFNWTLLRNDFKLALFGNDVGFIRKPGIK